MIARSIGSIWLPERSIGPDLDCSLPRLAMRRCSRGDVTIPPQAQVLATMIMVVAIVVIVGAP